MLYSKTKYIDEVGHSVWLLCVLSFLLATAFPEQSLGNAGQLEFRALGQFGGPTQGVAVQGSYAYVGVGQRLVALDVSDPSRPMEIGATGVLKEFVQGITVEGNTACVAAGGAGLWVVDISDPENPQEVGHCDTPGYAERVALAGHYAYVADGWAGLRVIDVSNQSHPAEVGFAYTSGYAFDVAVVGTVAYVAGGGSGLRTVDVANATHPEEIGYWGIPGYARAVASDGEFAYIADEWGGLYIANVHDPLHPVEVGFCKTPGRSFDLALEGNIIYIADAFAGVRMIDISNHSGPVEMGAYNISGHARDIVVAGNRAYVIDRNRGLRIADVFAPANPVEVGVYSPMGYARSVAVSGQYTYVAAYRWGFRIVDVANPSHPKEVGSHNTDDIALRVATDGEYAYVGTRNDLQIFDVHDPTRPTRVGRIHIREGCIRGMAVVGGIAYLAIEWGLELIDVSNPRAPSWTGYLSMVAQGTVVQVFVSGPLAYVAMEHGGFAIVDVSHPSKPTLVSTYNDGHFIRDIAVVGNIAYITGAGGFATVDISDPQRPIGLGTCDPGPGSAEGVTIADGIALVANGGGGVQAIDITNPSTLVVAGSYNTPGYAYEVKTAGDHIYVADGVGGMLILQGTDSISPGRQNFAAAHRLRSAIHPHSGLPPSRWKERTRHESRPPAASDLYIAPPPMLVGEQFWEEAGACDSPSSILENPPLEKGDMGGFLRDETRRQIPPNPPLRKGGTEVFALERPVTTTGSGARANASAYLAPTTRMVANTLVVSNPADGGLGTLRWCMEKAVAGDTIVFDSAVFPKNAPVVISVASELPKIDQGNITIDSSEAGVTLNGSRLPSGTTGSAGHGFIIVSDNNTIKGLHIVLFPNNGIAIFDGARNNIIGGSRSRGEGNVVSGNGSNIFIWGHGTERNAVKGNFIGTDASGYNTFDTVNKASSGTRGIGIGGGAGHNVIGGPTSDEGNVISGNGEGILLAETDDNIIIGNYIGTDVTGMKALGNQTGVSIVDGQRNTIGGTDPGERNIISGNNGWTGLAILRNSADNVIIGNFIGTDVSGKTELGNKGDGISIRGGSGNIIGGTDPGGCNIIAGNDGTGVSLYESADNNIVAGNFVGVDVSGKTGIGNKGHGVAVEWGLNNLISHNVSSGNARAGVCIWGTGSDCNTVISNYIGTDATGTVAIRNEWVGIAIGGDAAYNRIGGKAPEERNVISGNNIGLLIESEDNLVAGNYIGVDATGLRPLGNVHEGVTVSGRKNRIGGMTEVESNVISANLFGIAIGASAKYNWIAGNYIGTDVTGTKELGNNGSGIFISRNSEHNVIQANLISGNGWGGVRISENASFNVVRGNRIGTTANGKSPLPNIPAGVVIDSSSWNTIGGSYLGDGNIIAYNSQYGICIWSGSHNTIHGNVIQRNGGYGVYNDTTDMVDAKNNWWGYMSGPFDNSDDRATGGLYNPTGRGDKVSDCVDYEPWLKAPPPGIGVRQPWDVSKDGIVDISDFALVAQHFREVTTAPLDPDPDVNGDGIVDILDIVLVGQHFGEVYPSATPSRDVWSFDAKY